MCKIEDRESLRVGGGLYAPACTSLEESPLPACALLARPGWSPIGREDKSDLYPMPDWRGLSRVDGRLIP